MPVRLASSSALILRYMVEGEEAGAPIPLFLAHKNLQPYVIRHFGKVHYVPKKYVTGRDGGSS